jgi:hypothetical protein
MGLIDYSDSEGSDAEVIPGPAPSSTTSISHKPKTEKVVSGNKIRVKLPSSATPSNDAGEDIDNDRPSKRAKTGSASSGINSFLPAPKNVGKAANGTSEGGLLARNKGPGLRQGISLKTGAAPAFSREMPEVHKSYNDEVEGDIGYDGYGGKPTTASVSIIAAPIQPQEVSAKPIGKPSMFRPLSVGRKPAKKKNNAAQPAAEAKNLRPAMQATTSQVTAEASLPRPKMKQSLFSSFQDEPAAPTPTSTDYQPEFSEPIDTDRAFGGDDDSVAPVQAFAAAVPSQPPTSDLDNLASTLNLTPAQRRQLFGRDGASNAKLASFNLAQEYSSNNKLMQEEGGAAPLHNPVRGIAPGKHSLQQLVNAANNQRDALEESFARGKANKAAAGSKYGW